MSTLVLQSSVLHSSVPQSSVPQPGASVRAIRREPFEAAPSRPRTLRPVPAARAGRAASSAGAPLRLTRRGRVVVRVAVVLLGLLAAAAVVLAGGQRAVADPQGAPMRVEYRVVQPGESLWQIAGEVSPGSDRRDTVARIAELNDLRSGAVEVGTRIAVPAA